MKYIVQLVYILLFSLLGEVLQRVIPLPIPAAIYGMVLLLLALWTGILKPEKVNKVSSFLISIMPILFVAPAVGILEHWGVLAPNLLPICIIVAVSTVVVFAVSGLVTRLLQKKEGGERHG